MLRSRALLRMDFILASGFMLYLRWRALNPSGSVALFLVMNLAAASRWRSLKRSGRCFAIVFGLLFDGLYASLASVLVSADEWEGRDKCLQVAALPALLQRRVKGRHICPAQDCSNDAALEAGLPADLCILLWRDRAEFVRVGYTSSWGPVSPILFECLYAVSKASCLLDQFMAVELIDALECVQKLVVSVAPKDADAFDDGHAVERGFSQSVGIYDSFLIRVRKR
ncbi:hypothetical protein BJ741DRAFT_589551 [Chytriomyces cf. hyalinus JEL632]|nr:hypothetical protein BJ741DRAFT_589551 [Chytriomyces cf. hyalinus JEL632]